MARSLGRSRRTSSGSARASAPRPSASPRVLVPAAAVVAEANRPAAGPASRSGQASRSGVCPEPGGPPCRWGWAMHGRSWPARCSSRRRTPPKALGRQARGCRLVVRYPLLGRPHRPTAHRPWARGRPGRRPAPSARSSRRGLPWPRHRAPAAPVGPRSGARARWWPPRTGPCWRPGAPARACAAARRAVGWPAAGHGDRGRRPAGARWPRPQRPGPRLPRARRRTDRPRRGPRASAARPRRAVPRPRGARRRARNP